MAGMDELRANAPVPRALAASAPAAASASAAASIAANSLFGVRSSTEDGAVTTDFVSAGELASRVRASFPESLPDCDEKLIFRAVLSAGL